jgi:hypothetical protein
MHAGDKVYRQKGLCRNSPEGNHVEVLWVSTMLQHKKEGRKNSLKKFFETFLLFMLHIFLKKYSMIKM